MLPPSPPLSLSAFHSLCTDSISYNNNNKEYCKCRPQTHTPSFTTSDPESSTVSEVISLSRSVSLHACNYHLTFCTSIIFIFYCWFGSVRKRAHISDVASGINEIGAVAVEHRGEETPPLAISFCKVQIFLVK